MPFVTVKWFPRDEEKMAEAAQRVTEAIVKITGVEPKLVNIVFEDMPRDHFAQGGVLVSQRKS